MQSRLLSYFLVVYDHQNISTAAEMLRISQPAISKSIQNLEANLGIQLFERKPGGLVRTHYADILARHVRMMDIEYRHALAEIESASEGGEGLIRIGAGPIWYSCILPDVISEFLDQWPGTRIKLQSGVISTLLPGLQSGHFDLICSSFDFPNHAGIIKEPVLDINHIVIARHDHPLTMKESVTPQEMIEYPWIVLAEDHVGTGRILSYFAAHQCSPPRFAIETSSPTNMYEMLQRGDFLAQIPERLFEIAVRHRVRQLPIVGTFWETLAGVCYRQSENRLAVHARFIDAIRRKGIELTNKAR